jgi:type I restriction enzyme M protein
MLDTETKRRIDTARDILVGKVPDPKSQVEQITIALIYKFMDDMDAEAEELGGKRKFFSGTYERYSWKKLMSPSLGGQEVLNLYAEAIQQMNINSNIPQLFRDIFKNAYLPYRDPETLKSFLKIIDDFNYEHSEKLGDAFEYLLSVLGSQGDAGQFRTPRHIIDLMVYLIDPKKNETILDPACGTAGFLISSYKHIVKNNSSCFNQNQENETTFGNGDSGKYNGDKLTPDERKQLAVNIKGYDISPDMVRLSLVNLYLHGFADPKIVEYDTLTSEEKWNEHADIIMANPPFMSPKGGIKPHKRFSVESNRSEVLFVDYIAEHLSPNGRAAVIVPEGIIFQSGNAYKSLRKMLVEKYLYAVVSLPAGVFNPYSGVKTSILLMDKTLARKTDKILFAKIENDGFDLGAQRRANTKGELPEIAKAIKEFVKCVNNSSDFDSEATTNLVLATKDKIGENEEWNLSGERYAKVKIRLTSFNLVPISAIAKVESGFGFPLEKQGNKIGKYPFLKVSDMNLPGNEQYIKSWNNSIDDADVEELKLKIFPKHTVIFPKIGAAIATNKKRILTIPSAFDNNVMGIIPEPSKILYKYLFSLLQSINISDWASESSPPSMKKSTVENYAIPIPPLEIQKEIVAEIEGWQKIIDGARQVVENYKPQIEIDPSWEMMELGAVTDIISGFAFESLSFSKENGLKCVKITNVGVNEFIFDDGNNLPYDLLQKYSNFKVSTGDIVIALTRSIISTGLKVAIVPEEYNDALVNQRVAAIKGIQNTSNARFVYYYLSSSTAYNFILNKSRSLMQPNLSIKDLKSFRIPLPQIEIQNEIVSKFENERKLINSTKDLIIIFEQKIKDKIASVWGE